MRIRDIVQETSAEDHEIQEIATALADNLYPRRKEIQDQFEEETEAAHREFDEQSMDYVIKIDELERVPENKRRQVSWSTGIPKGEDPEEDPDEQYIDELTYTQDMYDQFQQTFWEDRDDEDTLTLGKLGELTDHRTENPKIERMLKTPVRIYKAPPGAGGGLTQASADWGQAINIDVRFLGRATKDQLESTITHEYRHTLDFIKADKWTLGQRYRTPRSTADEFSSYQSTPIEINARYSEAIRAAKLWLNRYVTQQNEFPSHTAIVDRVKQEMEEQDINQYFRKDVTDPAYRRLISRAVDFMDQAAAKAATTASISKPGNRGKFDSLLNSEGRQVLKQIYADSAVQQAMLNLSTMGRAEAQAFLRTEAMKVSGPGARRPDTKRLAQELSQFKNIRE